MTVTLTKPGDEVTMLVKSVAKVESTAKVGTFRYQIDGTLPNGQDERVYLNTPVVDKQLSHLILADAAALVGDAYRFYRIAAPNNTPAAGYLNIDPASPADFRPKADSKRVPSPSDQPPTDPDDPGPPEPDAPAAPQKGTQSLTTAQLAAQRLDANTEMYFALARKVAAFQAELSAKHEAPFDCASINSMTFSLWNNS